MCRQTSKLGGKPRKDKVSITWEILLIWLTMKMALLWKRSTFFALDGSLLCYQPLHISKSEHYFPRSTISLSCERAAVDDGPDLLMLMKFCSIISVAKMFKFYFLMWKRQLQFLGITMLLVNTLFPFPNTRIYISCFASIHLKQICNYLAFADGGSLVFPSYHTKSLQTEQNVGCPKKVAINSWFLM